MIRQNDFITELVWYELNSIIVKTKQFLEIIYLFKKSLADNRLGESNESLIELSRMLTENCILKKLNLSGNLFSDKDAEILIQSLDVYLCFIIYRFKML